MIIPTKDKREKFMKMVYDWADLSKDPRTRIGAVIVRDDVPISNGYNNFPRKVLDLEFRYNNREIKHQFIVHAERNSIFNAAKLGHKTDGATLYTQGIPCAECMQGVINAGIIKVICHSRWPNLKHDPKWVESSEIARTMMIEAGVELEWYNKVLNMTGWLDGKPIKV